MNLQIADLIKDKELLQLARNYAIRLLKSDPAMEQPQHQTVKKVFFELSRKKNIWNYIS